MNDVELVEDDHYKISVKEDEHLFRLDVLDITEDHCGKIKVVAKNENGEDSKEVSVAKILRNDSTFTDQSASLYENNLQILKKFLFKTLNTIQIKAFKIV